ncbi:hypothetical protein HFO56_42720 [Rhizobium laguerreae]|uniref:hypothetical protein n=1 Tax=Rhizobium laguerreae TaxID=1076926 RepID=UPI001C90E3E9|nr:hypothetical protein [Rhizobium laguerreae]MBY3158989.1 hypothetical protein [Rhizobium laguerreae]
MFALPTKGFQRSVNKHNVDLTICGDWIEACALFGDGEVTGSDIVDLLRENEVYESQDFAWELVNTVFAHVRERQRVLGDGYPLRVQAGTRVVATMPWQDFAPYAFCLLLSLPRAYPTWWRAFGNDFTAQGQLFEDLTAESVAATFGGWNVHKTGWSVATPNRISSIVGEIADLLGEVTGDVVRWSAAKAKEAGLDMLCFRPFTDGRVGIPVMLFQCASGMDWRNKLHAPEIRVWTKIVTFASEPKKAFAMPFTLEVDDFRNHTNVINGLLMDRDRLLAPGRTQALWTTPALNEQLCRWIEPRLATLPQTE